MYSVFKNLMEQKGVTPYEISKATGIPASAFTKWKQGISAPKADRLALLADYFSVPVEYLLTGEMPAGEGYYIDEETAKTAQALFENKDMRLLFDAARDASPEDLQMVAQILERLKRKENGTD